MSVRDGQEGSPENKLRCAWPVLDSAPPPLPPGPTLTSSVLEPPNSSPGGHRLGVNGLAVDRDNAILYSGGRDGVVCAWDLNLDLHSQSHSAVVDASTASSTTSSSSSPSSCGASRFRAQTQAHTHWINDIVLTQHHTTLISASSDLLVKAWRPAAGDEPVTIGQHADYVKCVGSPGQEATWVASGGLDRKILLWDVSGAGQTLSIDVSGEEVTEKGSVYALAATHGVLASGGPESIVRLWDPKTGKRVTKLVGHTDNVRAVLVNAAGDTVVTASSDQTVKVWSVTAGRCMHTLTMHADSVWSLFSEDPDLAVFYSSDRSGLVARTDVRDMAELDDGLCVAVAQEHEGVAKVVACGRHVWTATSRSSIHRWVVDDVDVDGDVPPQSVLPMSNANLVPVRDAETPAEPVHQLPAETIEGQFGLVKHRLLNDRRRVLTLDTAGDVLLWDLIQCRPLQSFGKRYLEDVEPDVNTLEAVAPWCSIDTSSGKLTVVLEPFNCFDAEMYADELPGQFREDQRINLGKWILRYLFAGLIDEEVERDVAYRAKLNESRPSISLEDSRQLGPAGAAGAGAGATPKRSSQASQATVDNDQVNAIHIEGQAPSEEAAKEARDKEAAKEKEAKEKDGKETNGTAKDKDNNAKSPTFKKFRMGMSFTKKLRSPSVTVEKPAVVDEESETSSSHEKEVEDSFLGVIQRIHNEYDKELAENPSTALESRITPTSSEDMPPLDLPPGTRVILQEETTGGSAEVYRGTVATVRADTDIIEQRGPMWLGEVLLTNTVPSKDPVKVSFILLPWRDALPPVTDGTGNNRLNANRMLRVKKILAYVAERIDPDAGDARPEDYLELWCNEQSLPPTMSLATLRAHVWKGGNDVVLHYKANGRRELAWPDHKKVKVNGHAEAETETPATATLASAG